MAPKTAGKKETGKKTTSPAKRGKSRANPRSATGGLAAVPATAKASSAGARPKRDRRIEVRATVEQERLITEAAALRGWTVTQFVLDAVVERAEELLRANRTLVLPNEVFDHFMAALEGEAVPVPELVELFNRPSPVPPA